MINQVSNELYICFKLEKLTEKNHLIDEPPKGLQLNIVIQSAESLFFINGVLFN